MNGYASTNYKGQHLTAEQFKGLWTVRWYEGGRCQSSEGWNTPAAGFKFAKGKIDQYLKNAAKLRAY